MEVIPERGVFSSRARDLARSTKNSKVC